MKLSILCLLLMTALVAIAPAAWAPPLSPVAVLTVSPNPGCVGEPITLDGCSSYHMDPSIEIVLYEFDFDGDGVYDWSSASECVATHTYTSENVWSPVLRVTDENGVNDVTSVELVISGASATEGSTWGTIKAMYR